MTLSMLMVCMYINSPDTPSSPIFHLNCINNRKGELTSLKRSVSTWTKTARLLLNEIYAHFVRTWWQEDELLGVRTYFLRRTKIYHRIVWSCAWRLYYIWYFPVYTQCYLLNDVRLYLDSSFVYLLRENVCLFRRRHSYEHLLLNADSATRYLQTLEEGSFYKFFDL